MRETLRVAAGIQAREGDDPKESSGCGESRRQTKGVCGKVRKGQKARPLLGFQLSLGHLPLGEEQANGDKSERSAGPAAILNTPSAFADNTACRPPDPGHNWSQGWLDARAPEAEAARHPLPHLHVLLRLLLQIEVWALLQDIELPCPPLFPLFIPAAFQH